VLMVDLARRIGLKLWTLATRQVAYTKTLSPVAFPMDLSVVVSAFSLLFVAFGIHALGQWR